MIDKICELAKSNTKISDFHLRDGSDISYRLLGDIVIEPDSQITDNDLYEGMKTCSYNTPQLKESLYYREIFSNNYRGFEKTIPYLWLPKWSGNIKDPSARILGCYE